MGTVCAGGWISSGVPGGMGAVADAGSETLTRICGAPHWEQKSAPSVTCAPQR